MTAKAKINQIIKQAIDLHVHIGPEIIPRKYTTAEIVKKQSGKIAGLALKNHFNPTTPFIQMANPKRLKLIGSVVLNNSVGGLNPEAIYGAAYLSGQPIIVWLPTINAGNFLKNSLYDIPPEWIGKKGFKARKSQDVKGIYLVKNGLLTDDVNQVLKAIDEVGGILATGHVSWQEALIVARKALSMNIRTIITHPIYQRIAMPVKSQRELALAGAYIEQCYSIFSIDKIPVKKIANQIKAVGTKYCFLSSDVGQTFSPDPDEALKKFAWLLCLEGISLEELEQMLVENPGDIISRTP